MGKVDWQHYSFFYIKGRIMGNVLLLYASISYQRVMQLGISIVDIIPSPIDSLVFLLLAQVFDKTLIFISINMKI